jgi:hypothetical protein
MCAPLSTPSRVCLRGRTCVYRPKSVYFQNHGAGAYSMPDQKIIVIDNTAKWTSEHVDALKPEERIEIGALIRVYNGDIISLVAATRMTKKALQMLDESFTSVELDTIKQRVAILLNKSPNNDLLHKLLELEEKNSGKIVGLLYREIRLAAELLDVKRHKANYRDLINGIHVLIASVAKLKELAPKDMDEDVQGSTWGRLRNNYTKGVANERKNELKN